MQKNYSTLYRVHRDQNPSEAFAYFPQDRNTGETWLDKTAAQAESEGWDFVLTDEEDELVKRHSVLARYLDFVFVTAQEQERLQFSSDRQRICMNTNLRTPFGQQLYLSFFKNRFARIQNHSDYIFFGVFPEASHRLNDFRPLPEPVSFLTQPEAATFHPDFDLVVNAEHIIVDHAERLPEPVASNRHLAFTAITGAVAILKQRLKVNFSRLAIPMIYRDRVQHLLPLNIMNSEKPDLALVADPDNNARTYLVKTALPLAHAYLRARLIASDTGWLKAAVA